MFYYYDYNQIKEHIQDNYTMPMSKNFDAQNADEKTSKNK